MAAHHEVGFTRDGLKSACARLQRNGTMDRAAGSGGKRSRGTPDTVDSVRKYFEVNSKASCGDAASDFGMPRATIRAILTQDIDTRPSRHVATQRVNPSNAEKRLNICRIRGAQIERGELDVEKIFFTYEKVFRIGACAGGTKISSYT